MVSALVTVLVVLVVVAVLVWAVRELLPALGAPPVLTKIAIVVIVLVAVLVLLNILLPLSNFHAIDVD